MLERAIYFMSAIFLSGCGIFCVMGSVLIFHALVTKTLP